MDWQNNIAELLARKIRNELGPEEEGKLERWLAEDPSHRELYLRVSDPKRQVEKLGIYDRFDMEESRSRLEDKLFGEEKRKIPTQKILRFAAAILLPLLIIGGLTWRLLRVPGEDLMAEIDTHIHSGQEEAVLVLADGRQIRLGEETEIEEVSEGRIRILKDGRGIRYLAGREATQATPMFNELLTPRGGTFRLTLEDGSRVWLNAESSLRYPVSFADSVRRVELEGEAYFEVEHGTRPFIVESGDLQTRVLGTSFNVRAYPGDPLMESTLVEGRVEVSTRREDGSVRHSLILDPNEQAILDMEEEILRSQTVDATGYMSWVDGKMEFHRESLEEVMKRLSRWYNFEYRFENEKARTLNFSARLDRSSDISEVLDMLSMTTDVRFEFRDQEIIVY